MFVKKKPPSPRTVKTDSVQELLRAYPPEISGLAQPPQYIIDAANLRAKHSKLFPGLLPQEWDPERQKAVARSAKEGPGLTSSNDVSVATNGDVNKATVPTNGINGNTYVPSAVEKKENEKFLTELEKVNSAIAASNGLNGVNTSPKLINGADKTTIEKPLEPKESETTPKKTILSENLFKTPPGAFSPPAATSEAKPTSETKFIPPHLRNLDPTMREKALAAAAAAKAAPAPLKPTGPSVPKPSIFGNYSLKDTLDRSNPKTAVKPVSQGWLSELEAAKSDVQKIKAAGCWTLTPMPGMVVPKEILETHPNTILAVTPQTNMTGVKNLPLFLDTDGKPAVPTKKEGAARWPTPDERTRAPAQHRSIRLTNLPMPITLSMVTKCCTNTGMIDRISLNHFKRCADVHFVRPEDARTMYKTSANGIECPDGTVVWAEMLNDIDILPSQRREKIDAGASRVVRIVGFDEGDIKAVLFQLTQIKKADDESAVMEVALYFAGKANEREDVQFAMMKVNKMGHREARLCFASVETGYRARATLMKNSCLETANVTYGLDP